MDNISKSESVINKLYDKLTYFDVYGGSVFVSIVLIVIPLVVCSYFFIMKNAQPIKNDWAAQRCHPYVIPFAGMINKPDDKTSFEFTEENLSFCVQNILTSMTGYLVEPITYVTSALTTFFDDLTQLFQKLRMVMSNVRSAISDIAKEILGRIANIMIPLQNILIKFKDSMAKLKGILVTSLYTSMGAFLAFKSLLGSVVQITTLILVMFAGVVIAMWILGFFFPPMLAIASGGSILFAVIAAILLPLISFMKDHLDLNIDSSIPSLPGRPSCFDKDTLLKMRDSSFKKISDIEVGDILFNDDKVTAKMKLNSTNIDMFELNGGTIVVSGCHRVKHDGQWIYVNEYPEKNRITHYSEPFIYCLNTESKRIWVDTLEFCDWDEVFEKESEELLNHINKSMNMNMDIVQVLVTQ